MFNANVQALQSLRNDMVYENISTMYLGYDDGGTTVVDAGNGYVWVRTESASARGRLKVINAGVNAAYANAPVLVGSRTIDGSLCAFGPSYGQSTVTTFGAKLVAAGVPLVAPEVNVQTVPAANIIIGRVTPSSDYRGTLFVYISEFWYKGYLLGGINYDVGSSNVPGTTGQHRWAWITVDTTNTAYTEVGTAFSLSGKGALSLLAAADVAITSGRVPVALLSLSYGQTDIVDSRFEDGREWLNARFTDTSGYASIKQAVASGTNGGTFTSGAWQTRPLTTISTTSAFASLSSNVITLAAGTYRVSGSALGNQVDWHQLRLRNTTDSATLLVGVLSFAAAASPYGATLSSISGRFTLAASKSVELQHYGQTTRSTDGFGSARSFGEDEVYAELVIVRE